MTSAIRLRLDTLEIPVSDLQTSRNWYQTVFGVRTSSSDENHCQMAAEENDGPGVKFLLVQTESGQSLGFKNSSTDVDHSFADMEVDDLDGFYAALKDKGIKVPDLEEPKYDWAPKGFALQDPDGNRFGIFSFRKD
ncbi:VOC family protein [Labrenzia sp. PHM005]|uniref:VOC family protein n=1 Tax=Labrenzia sp. PHM005 TaxID=2590016 RepID=UPI0011400E19|nr:VOC family protein [Labrenzia sp. PHM005]QDG78246.1 VOC family protein [Labrenzia sp. PHM005]